MTPHIESSDLDPLMQGEAPGPELPLTPQARVDASRAALQLWILRTYHPERLPPTPEAMQAARDHAEDSDPPWLAAIVDAVNEVPGVAIGARYMRRWWRRHPFYATFHMADETGRELLRPMARSHPWLLLGGAVTFGVLAGRLRPWRYISGRTMLAGLLPPISLASILTAITAMFAPATPPAPDSGYDPADPDLSPSPSQSQFQSPAADLPARSAETV
jgi:hypothetical protein